MSSPRSTFCALLVLAFAALGTADAPAAYVHKDKCNLDGHRTVALTKQVRVFADHDRLTGGPPDAELNLWTATRRARDSGDISDVHVEGDRLVWTQAGTRLSTSFD